MNIPGRLGGTGAATETASGSPDVPFVVDTASQLERQLCSHQLNTPWTFWLDKTERGLTAAQFEAALKEIYTVETVEQFWAVFSNIPDVCDLKLRYSYHMMRHRRRPLWEEPAHAAGGVFKIKCHKSHSSSVWKELLLACIGEQLEDCIAPDDNICGVSISIREHDDFIQIWNSRSDLAAQATVVAKLQSLVPNAPFLANFYKRHETHQAFDRRHSVK